MELAYINKNDLVNSISGITVSMWCNYCPFRCKGCHNSELWDRNEELKINNLEKLSEDIISYIGANGIKRNFSVLGGEPLCDINKEGVTYVINKVKEAYPEITIYLWTGNTYDDIKDDETIKNVDVLITEPFVESERDLTLKLMGSRNQKIYYHGKQITATELKKLF